MTGRVPGDLPHEFESDDGRALCMWCHTFREDAGGQDQSNEECAVRLRNWISALDPVAHRDALTAESGGRVRVEMSRDLAAFGAEFAEQTRDKLANQPDPVGSWLCEGRESLRRLAESLRAALAKGEQ